MRPRLLIVDDHPLTREALGALLDQNGFTVVGEARTARRRSSRRGLQPELVLLDLSMPGLDGLAGPAAAPRRRSRVRGGRPDRLGHRGQSARGDTRGAAGYLLKSEPPSGSSSSSGASSRGEAALSGAVARRLLDQVRYGGRRNGGCPTRSPARSARARSRCCSCSTSTSAPTRSRSGSSSPSTPSARTSRACSASSTPRRAGRRSRRSPSPAAPKSPTVGDPVFTHPGSRGAALPGVPMMGSAQG